MSTATVELVQEIRAAVAKVKAMGAVPNTILVAPEMIPYAQAFLALDADRIAFEMMERAEVDKLTAGMKARALEEIETEMMVRAGVRSHKQPLGRANQTIYGRHEATRAHRGFC